MQIAINTTPMTGGHSLRGIGLYTKELTCALAAYEDSHSYTLFEKISDIDPKADVVHYPFFDPFFLTMPWMLPKRVVVTVHDLIPIAYSDHFPRGIRGEVKWQIQKYLLRRVDSIITDSAASKLDIHRFIGFPEGRIGVVPLAPRTGIRRVVDKNILSKIIKKYKLNTKFVLYVGDVNWNKNIPGLFNAYQSYVKKTGNSMQLVCVGKAFVDFQIGKSADINTLGFVPDEDLAALYSLAEVLVHPSFAEGFGLPVLEAMACGCPVIASDVPSLQEIAGPSILVDPHKTEDIRRGFDMVLSMSGAKRRAMVEEGISWAGKFSWKKVAQETVKMYEKTISYYPCI